jgi:hypothetical protein
MSIEKRLHPRILLEWPAAVKTLKGTIEGITKDISVDGVFISCPEEPELENTSLVQRSLNLKIVLLSHLSLLEKSSLPCLVKGFGRETPSLMIEQYSEWVLDSHSWLPKTDNTLLP